MLYTAFSMIMVALFATAFLAMIVLCMQRNRKYLFLIGIIYLLFVLVITLFARMISEVSYGISLVPFRFIFWIVRFIKGKCFKSLYRTILGVYMNILMFIPFGFLFKCTRESTATWEIVLVGFCFSLLIELTQMIFHLGMFETDDLMTNTLGTWLGTVIYRKRMQKA